MRTSKIFLVVLLVVFILDVCLAIYVFTQVLHRKKENKLTSMVATSLGLSDLALATEARYTRHPAVSDPMAPFMDHPGAIEHFPTGTFWAAPGN